MAPDVATEDILKNLYYDAKSPVAFGSFTSFKKHLRKNKLIFNETWLKRWLRKQLSYSLHLERKKHFLRNRVFAMRIDENWQCDLVDMQMLAKHNDQVKYLLTCIDVFSKFAWVRPLLRKDAQTVITAFKQILMERQPEKIQFDLGKEFNNKYFRDLLSSNNIHYMVAENSAIKCSVVERFHRTLKSRMYKYFTAMNTMRYIDALQSFVEGYNHATHSSIKMAPADVSNENKRLVFFNLFRKQLISGRTPIIELALGDRVRVIDLRHVFQKGFKQRWSDEIFLVKNIIERPMATMYVLIDYKKRELNRSYYAAELQKVEPNVKLRAENIFDVRNTEHGEEKLVTIKGYPSLERIWVSSRNLY